ncbi:UrcA family protein [Sandarakinorhabdus sp. DWP1-3-1]|uniref:UrcA family protein n=1 Tax=Sandarakinorhabdus sp. DWP1-3-1 TaxID=2804627 RepID=UPI003CF76AA4
MIYDRLLPLLAITLLGMAAPAVATPVADQDSIRIDTSNIDLGSETGRQALERRVERAVKAVCGAPVFGTLDEEAELRACREERRAAVAPQLRALLARADAF